MRALVLVSLLALPGVAIFLLKPEEEEAEAAEATEAAEPGETDAVHADDAHGHTSHEKGRPMNRLAKEKSPYLLQHATNPVDWYPWGDEAFAKAKAEGKPVFLSIGYSSCHWCHVMEHESFADEAVAAYMNKHFVCIKVDREERPDVDSVYMNAAMAIMGGGGGWPLSVWLTSDRKPFHAGTYFPPRDMQGRPSFMRILTSVVQSWGDKEQKARILAGADNIVGRLRDSEEAEDPADISAADLESACDRAAAYHDEVFGGFGVQPKFPSPSTVAMILRRHLRKGDAESLAIVNLTLTKMAHGGIHDHIGGGFHRYSVTRDWLVPHFEKMLYDNAQLLSLYAWAYQVTGDELYKETAEDIALWVKREMTDPSGGFYSAQDADDPGGPEGEGGFYVWSPAEINALFDGKEAAFLKRWFDVSRDGNWHERPGKSILQVKFALEEAAKAAGIDVPAARAAIKKARETMYPVREKRPKPMTDTKVLTAWNGLMISGYARAYQALGNADYLAMAQKAAAFIKKTMTLEGKLLRRWREGDAAHAGVLDDYAYMIAAYLDLYESDFDASWLEEALRLTRVAIDLFYDGKEGGFYYTARDGEALISRSRPGFDNARPSGNGVMPANLLRLFALTGDTGFRDKAQKTLRYFGARSTQSALGFGAILNAAAYSLDGGREIFIAGDPADAATRALIEAVWRDTDRNRAVAVVTPGIEKLLPPAAGKVPVNGKPAAYVCRNFTCELPVTDPAKIGK
ncbi:MAG: thioredoxin domain-containing protein [Planctomycetota bacterium]